MKRILLALLLVSMFSLALGAGPGLKIIKSTLNWRGVNYDFASVGEDSFEALVVCTEDTGAVDIVFVLDITSSMRGYINTVRDNIAHLAITLDTLGYDYAFGIVVYKDPDFRNLTPFGRDLTSDTTTIKSWLSSISTGGGGSDPEDALHGLWVATHDMHWRPGATRVIVLVTDVCFCTDSSSIIPPPCPSCTTHFSRPEVYDAIVDAGIITFVITRWPTPLCNICTGYTTMEARELYELLARITGGGVFYFHTPIDTIFTSLIPYISAKELIQVYIQNVSPDTIETLSVNLDLGTCIRIIHGDNPMTKFDIAPGETVDFVWTIDYMEGCIGPPACFRMTAAGGGYSVFSSHCMYVPNCACSPVQVENIWPRLGVWSACDPQVMKLRLTDDDLGVDTSWIVFEINGTRIRYHYDPKLVLKGDTLEYTHAPGEFRTGDTVRYAVVDARDLGGCGLQEPRGGWYIVDRQPPMFSNYQPPLNATIGGMPSEVSVVITDQHSGVDVTSPYFIFNGTDTFTLDDPSVTFDGRILRFVPPPGYRWSFGDSIEVCVHADDRVSPQYCGPNHGVDCWHFFIDYLRLTLPDTVVPPNASVAYPIKCSDPSRFNITHFDLRISYCTDIFDVYSVYTGGTASRGFIVSWDTAGGILHINGYKAFPMVSSDVFIKLFLKTKDVPGGYYSPMRFVSVSLNHGEVGYATFDGMLMIKFEPAQWLHPLIFTGKTATGYLEPTTITIGAADGATDGYDPTLDLLILPPPPTKTDVYSLISDPDYPSVTRLGRDIHNRYSVPSEWRIVTQATPGSLYWNPHSLPDGIFRLNGRLDMKLDSIYHYALGETIVITYEQPLPAHLTIDYFSGWNMLGIPATITMPNWIEFIPDFFAGPFTYDNPTNMFYLNRFPKAGFGFWIYATDQGVADVCGIPFHSGSIIIHRGWNLIGSIDVPARIETDPSGIIVAIYGWDSSAGVYTTATADNIQPGKAYWVLSTSDGVLTFIPR